MIIQRILTESSVVEFQVGNGLFAPAVGDARRLYVAKLFVGFHELRDIRGSLSREGPTIVPEFRRGQRTRSPSRHVQLFCYGGTSCPKMRSYTNCHCELFHAPTKFPFRYPSHFCNYRIPLKFPNIIRLNVRKLFYKQSFVQFLISKALTSNYCEGDRRPRFHKRLHLMHSQKSRQNFFSRAIFRPRSNISSNLRKKKNFYLSKQ